MINYNTSRSHLSSSHNFFFSYYYSKCKSTLSQLIPTNHGSRQYYIQCPFSPAFFLCLGLATDSVLEECLSCSSPKSLCISPSQHCKLNPFTAMQISKLLLNSSIRIYLKVMLGKKAYQKFYTYYSVSINFRNIHN